MKPAPTVPKPSKFLVVQVMDPVLVRQFAVDLKGAADATLRKGGTYSAFLLLSNGRKLQVEVG